MYSQQNGEKKQNTSTAFECVKRKRKLPVFSEDGCSYESVCLDLPTHCFVANFKCGDEYVKRERLSKLHIHRQRH